MSVFLIPDGLAGERLDAVAARVSGYSRSRIESLVEAGNVTLDGAPVAKGSVRVREASCSSWRTPLRSACALAHTWPTG